VVSVTFLNIGGPIIYLKLGTSNLVFRLIVKSTSVFSIDYHEKGFFMVT